MGPARDRAGGHRERGYRVVLPVEDLVRHQHEGHQWVHILDGTARSGRETADFSTWEPHALVAVQRPAEALIVFRPITRA